MSLRKQLTLALLILALVPSTLVSILALRQVHQVNQLWESAGAEEALTSSVSVAKESLHRLERDLDLASDPLVERWRDHAPDFRTDSRERLYVSRFLDDLELSFVQVYAPTPDGFRLESAAYPESTVVRHVDLSDEISQYELGSGALQSATGAFAVVRQVADGRRVAIGHVLAPDFFGRMSELQLGLGTYRALAVYARVFRTYLLVVMALILLAVAGLAVGAAYWISRRLAGPVTELSRRLETMESLALPQPIPEPAHATPEVGKLARALNSLTGRLRAAQGELLLAERVAGSAQVARQVAHEIKNSLSTLEYATIALERAIERMPESERRLTQESVEAMSREFSMLKDMAETFSLLGRMAEPLARHPIDLNQLVHSIRAPYAEAPIEFVLDLDHDLPSVLGDERALRRLLTNLVKNALEAQDGRLRLSIRTRREPGNVRVDVEDQGRGIPREVLARVFDPGFTTKGETGSGFGLFLARSIVEQHGGTIGIEPRAGGGTVVRVRLPAVDTRRSAA